jgi:hypothetical protein
MRHVFAVRASSQILGETLDQRALEPLTDALNDRNPVVQTSAAEALKAINLARAAGPPPTSDVAYKVIPTFDVTGPFHTKTTWAFSVFQKPDTCDPGVSDGCNGDYEFCFRHLSKSKCTEVAGANLDDASIVPPVHGPPLMVTATNPDVATSGAGMLYTDIWVYGSQTDTFENVFSSQSSRNNNEETRIMKNGPLAGTVIDSEMPEIERRLGFWKSGDPLPVPERAQCASYMLKNGIEWCQVSTRQ